MDYNSSKCLSCGNEHMAPIMYGYPSEKMVDLARQEIIALGGCTIREDNPTHYCYSCGEVQKCC